MYIDIIFSFKTEVNQSSTTLNSFDWKIILQGVISALVAIFIFGINKWWELKEFMLIKIISDNKKLNYFLQIVYNSLTISITHLREFNKTKRELEKSSDNLIKEVRVVQKGDIEYLSNLKDIEEYYYLFCNLFKEDSEAGRKFTHLMRLNEFFKLTIEEVKNYYIKQNNHQFEQLSIYFNNLDKIKPIFLECYKQNGVPEFNEIVNKYYVKIVKGEIDENDFFLANLKVFKPINDELLNSSIDNKTKLEIIYILRNIDDSALNLKHNTIQFDKYIDNTIISFSKAIEDVDKYALNLKNEVEKLPNYKLEMNFQKKLILFLSKKFTNNYNF